MFATLCFPLRLILWPLGVGVATLVLIVAKLATVWVCGLVPSWISSLLRVFPCFSYFTLSSRRMYRFFVSFHSFSLIPSYLRSLCPYRLSLRSFPFWAEFLYIHLRLRLLFIRFQWPLVILTDISLPDTSIFPTVGPGTSSKSFISSSRLERITAVSPRHFFHYVLIIRHFFPFLLVVRR